MSKNSKPDWDKLNEEVRVPDINEAMLEHASLFVTYAPKYMKAVRDEQQKKWELESVISAVKQRLKESITATESASKASEARLNRECLIDMEVQSAQEEYNEASAVTMEWRLVLEALRMRKDLLISLSANEREEMAQGIQSHVDTGKNVSAALDRIRNSIVGKEEITEPEEEVE